MFCEELARVRIVQTRMAKVALPRGPRFGLWQIVRYLRDPEGMLRGLTETYGDVYSMPGMGGGTLVVTATPDGVRSIFGADPDTFEPFSVESMTPVLGSGSLLLQHGATHRRARKLLAPPFHGARMRSYGQTMATIAARRLRSAPTAPFDIEQLFRDVSLEVILQTVFGVQDEAEVHRARQLVLDTLAGFSPLFAMFQFLRRGFFPPWRRFRALLDATHALLRAQIGARRASPTEDICGMLVAARDDAGEPMAEQEIIEQLFTMVIAGHETTATALAWSVDELWRAPDVLAQLREELRSTDGDPDKLAANKLLDAVIAEALRLHPLVPIVSRRLATPFAIDGYELPAKTGIGANMWAAHRNPAVFERPTEFVPSRFLEAKTFSPQQYFPFGGGARRCIGAAFAFYEMKIVLGKLVLEGDLSLRSPMGARTGPDRKSVV